MVNISDRDLESMLLTAAILSDKDPSYLPIFVRLHAEFDARKARTDALGKARAIVSRHKCAAPSNVTSFLRLTG